MGIRLNSFNKCCQNSKRLCSTAKELCIKGTDTDNCLFISYALLRNIWMCLNYLRFLLDNYILRSSYCTQSLGKGTESWLNMHSLTKHQLKNISTIRQHNWHSCVMMYDPNLCSLVQNASQEVFKKNPTLGQYLYFWQLSIYHILYCMHASHV
jgi:hypothetical protein